MTAPDTKGSPRPPQLAYDQVLAALVGTVNTIRSAAEQQAARLADFRLERALEEMTKVREFLGSPANILGRMSTKHGEVAEHINVAVLRARDHLHGIAPTAVLEAGRLDAVDYWVDGSPIQSKYINGANNSLTHVQGHMDKYAYFASGQSARYHIPRDQAELLERIRRGDPGGLNPKSVSTLLTKVAEIEERTGLPFDAIVQPGVSTYAEVQLGRAHETLQGHEATFEEKHQEQIGDITDQHRATLREGLKVGASAAAVAGGVSLAASCVRKYRREGKNVFSGDFTQEDWIEVGLSAGTAGAVAGVSATTLYALTNWGKASAPLAGAYVAAAKGMAPLVAALHSGEISQAAFADEALLVCTDTAVITLFAVAGQTLCPAPVLGAMLGAFAGQVAMGVLKEQSAEGLHAVQARAAELRRALARKNEALVGLLDVQFAAGHSFAQFAFSVKGNAELLAASAALARVHGLPEERILTSPAEVRSFLSG